MFFDFDGTVCDTERAALRSWQRLYGTFGQEFDMSVWGEMAGNANGALLAESHLCTRIGRPLTSEELRLRLSWKGIFADQEPVRDGLLSLLDFCDDSGLTTAIVTSAKRSWVAGHLARLDLAQRFQAIICAGGATRPKPSPDLYHEAMRLLRVTANEVLAVEDSNIGITAAKAASIYCIGVPSAACGAQFTVAPDLVVRDLALAMQSLGGLREPL